MTFKVGLTGKNFLLRMSAAYDATSRQVLHRDEA